MLSCLHLVYSPLLEVVKERDLAGYVKICLQNMPALTDVPDDITQVKLELLRKTIATTLFQNDGKTWVYFVLLSGEKWNGVVWL